MLRLRRDPPLVKIGLMKRPTLRWKAPCACTLGRGRQVGRRRRGREVGQEVNRGPVLGDVVDAQDARAVPDRDHGGHQGHGDHQPADCPPLRALQGDDSYGLPTEQAVLFLNGQNMTENLVGANSDVESTGIITSRDKMGR